MKRSSVIPYLLTLLLLLAPAFVQTLAGGSGILAWAFTIAQAFAGWHLLVFCLMLIGILATLSARKKLIWAWLLPATALSIYSMVSIAGPWQMGRLAADAEDKPSTGALRILHANLYLYNSRETLPDLVQLIQQRDPDIIILHELDAPHHAFLGAELLKYPHRRINTKHPYFGSGIYSRLPLKNVQEISTRIETLVYFELESWPLEEGCRGEPNLTVITVHPVAPFNPRILGIHRRALDHLAHYAKPNGHEILVTGDFNSVDWSRDMRLFQERTGLRKVYSDDFLRRLFRGTYSAQWPDIFRLPIDGVMLSDGLNVSGMERVDIPGSDHQGVLVDIQWPSEANCDSLKNLQRSRP